MPLSFGLHRDFSSGIVRDVASELAPENSVYDAVDCVFDQPGKIRKRGGTTAVFTGAQTATGSKIGALDTGTRDGIKRLYTAGGKSGNQGVWQIDRTTGAQTALAALDNTASIGRPFQHYGTLVFPNFQTGAPSTNTIAVGGASGAKSAGTITSVTLTNGSDLVTGFGATTAYEAGQLISLYDGSTRNYLGRITEVVNGTTLRVWPTPTFSATVNGNSFNAWGVSPFGGGYPFQGGRIGFSYQNRIVLLNTIQWTSSTVYEANPRRVAFTALDTEASIANTGVSLTGLPLHGDYFLTDNWFEIPGSDPITAGVDAGDNVMLIFGTNSIHRVSGYLLSQTTTNATLGADRRTLSTLVGCIGQQSLQKTPRGVIFAAPDGVYATDGAQVTPLMQNRVANAWRDAMKSGVTIYGSALLRGNHYYLSCSDYGRLVNLDTLAWSRITNAAIFDGVLDPADSSKVWGLRWWDTTGAAPSMTNGQAIQLQSFFAPSSSTKNDADGTAVQAGITTRAYPDGYQKNSRRYDNPLLLKRYRHPNIEYSLAGTGTITVAVQATLDPSQGSYTSLGTLPTTSGLPGMVTLDAAGAYRGFGIAYQITQTGATDSFELLGILSRYLPTEFARAA